MAKWVPVIFEKVAIALESKCFTFHPYETLDDLNLLINLGVDPNCCIDIRKATIAKALKSCGVWPKGDYVYIANGDVVGSDYSLLPGDVIQIRTEQPEASSFPLSGKTEPITDFVSARDAAIKLDVSVSMIYKLLKNGSLPFETRGSRKLIPLSAIENYRQQCQSTR